MSSSLERFKNTYSYKELVNKYSLDHVGLWEVRGEDANCDFGGSHSMPVLFHVEGRLEDVIRKAVEHQRFWTWGGGGDVRLINVLKMEDIDHLVELQQEKRKLESRIKEIEKQLEKS